MKFPPLALFIVILLSSCASQGGKKEAPPLVSQKMEQRLRKPDLNRRSVYDKSMQASLGKNSKTASWLNRQKHQTNSFAGTKTFSQTPGFKTSSFSGADSKSAMGRQSFAEAGKTPAYADNSFATPQSRFSNQRAREGTKSFAGSDDVFRTSANRDALASQAKNDRPKFIELEDNARTPAYSEDQVRRLMGRD